MAKKPNLTTKTQYKNGYEAAQNNQPRRSPHRDGTASEDIWFAGYDAYMDGDTPPQEPRKKRTKAEMEAARTAPPKSTLPESMRRRSIVPTYNAKPRADGWLEKLFKAQADIKTETDSELLELLHMEIADLNWIIDIQDGPKPSTVWEEYKRENNLNFDLKVA